jgi:hypothetical protein
MIKGNHINGKLGVLVKQRVKTNTPRVILLALAIFVAALSVSPQTFAAAANVLKVSPVRSDIEIPAGTSKTVETAVTNLTSAPVTVRPIENDFVAGDERGTPALILDADKYAPTHSLKRFMTPLPDVTIPAKQTKVVNVVITVPKDAQPGGYFGAVRFAPTAPEGGGQVNLSASAASLILMTVPGPATEKLELTDFSIQQDGRSGTTFQNSNDLQLALRFKNTGSVQQGPIGKVSVKQGDKLIYDVDFNNKEQRDMILPDSARRWEIPLKKIGNFGQYTVVATFTYGTKNQTIEVEKTFWVIPMSVIIGTIVGLVVLVGLVVGIILFLKSYKRRILRGRGGLGSGSNFRRH